MDYKWAIKKNGKYLTNAHCDDFGGIDNCVLYHSKEAARLELEDGEKVVKVSLEIKEVNTIATKPVPKPMKAVKKGKMPMKGCK